MALGRFIAGLISLTLLALGSSMPATADLSHVRIVRLSLVQGDVRYARDVHGDPAADDKAVWESAPLNLPIRQGYVLATQDGRAEVEFENGARIFLKENTTLEFYDLSLSNGASTTRLVLRQGSAVFAVNSEREDYFSVTGGDFTVEAANHSKFRLDDFNDGSTVDVLSGRVTTLRDKTPASLQKGQSFSVKAGTDAPATIGSVPENDDFDRWAAAQLTSSEASTAAAVQYSNYSAYNSGFGDLFTYGSFVSFGGGYGWRPYGAGLGWSPFDNGGWAFDPVFGWSFIGAAPWGWLPYHYGSWVFASGSGWLWLPSGFGYGFRPVYRPVTAVWVHSATGTGIVPVHASDAHNRTPINIAQGVFPVKGSGVASSAVPAGGDDWKVVKSAPKETLTSSVRTTSRPTAAASSSAATAAGVRQSSIAVASAPSISSRTFVPRSGRITPPPARSYGSSGGGRAASNGTGSSTSSGAGRSSATPSSGGHASSGHH